MASFGPLPRRQGIDLMIMTAKRQGWPLGETGRVCFRLWKMEEYDFEASSVLEYL
jgi:hypothetical protein